MNENESTAANARQEQISSETRKFQDKQTVENFFADNPKYSYDVVKQIIPNAIQKRYEDGEINIETVLSVGKQLLDGAPIESVLAPDSPQIGKVAGSDKPTNGAKEKQVEKDWATSLV